MSNDTIYLDYAATTPTDPRVVDAMLPYLYERFGNPASRSHTYGWEAEKAVDTARAEVADLVGCDAKDIVWTSGATESINLAIKGAASFYGESKGKHIVTIATEHKATLDTCREMERLGFRVTYLLPQADGMINITEFTEALTEDTVLASVVLVNNEIGVIQDIPALSALCRARGILFHCDAAQATGKVDINLAEWSVDLMSFSAHKTYGPKGIGALYVRRKPRVRLHALMHGGGHERGLRSGTLATHQIVGMGAAFRLAKLEMHKDNEHITKLRDYFWAGIEDLPEIYLNGDEKQRVPNNMNVSFNFVEGESLIMALKKLAISSGSACTSASLEPSYVLRALGRSDELAHSSLRISFGRFTTIEQVGEAITLIREKVGKLRDLSPLWEMHNEGIDVSTYDWKEATH